MKKVKKSALNWISDKVKIANNYLDNKTTKQWLSSTTTFSKRSS